MHGSSGTLRWSSSCGGGPAERRRLATWTNAGNLLRRAEHDWLRAGSHMVQQQALRDFSQAMASFFSGTHRKPTWRKAGRNEGFRVVAVKPGQVRRLSRHVGELWIPKVGWVRFRWSRAVPAAKSYRVTLDRAGRWHLAFAALPAPIAGPGAGKVVGIDRGITVSAALSTGETLTVPRPGSPRQRRLAVCSASWHELSAARPVGPGSSWPSQR